MLRQTLVSFHTFSLSSSLVSPSPGSSSSSFPFPVGGLSSSPPYLHSAQEKVELKEEMLSDEVDYEAWEVVEERSSLLCEDFQVDDLLDLRGLPESEEEDEKDARITDSSFSILKSLPSAGNDPLELYSEISIQETDSASLEWLSHFFDDSSKEFIPSPPQPSRTESLVPVKAKRSKRLRGNGKFWSRSGSLILSDSSPASSITTLTATSPSPSSSSSSSSFNSYISPESFPSISFIFGGKAMNPKKRGRKPKGPLMFAAERRCTHCGVHKTPQWRAGPHGAKTLCNACGVRFKSGRLLPEYRPACSPTFVSEVHSNSHRKVLEMRRKRDEQPNLVLSATNVTSR